MKKENENSQRRYSRIEVIIRLILKALIPIILLVGGLYLLHLRITGWSLILGLPMTVMGTALMIIAYDEVASKAIDVAHPRFVIFEPKFVKCAKCEKKTPRVPGEWEEDIVCPKCRSLKEEKGKRKNSS